MDEVKEEKHLSVLRSVRKKCLECSGGSSNEVKLCPIKDCALFPYRFGRNPYRAKREISEERKQAMAEALAKYRRKQQEEVENVEEI